MSFTHAIALEDEMKKHIWERDTHIRTILCCMLAREHALILGVPGTGKTFFNTVLQRAISNATSFNATLNEFSTPDEIAGMIDPNEMMSGRIRRMTDGMASDCHLVAIEEIFKSNKGCLAILTDILCDGVVKMGSIVEPIKSVLIVGTSNELPQDESLDYMWDRFMARFWVNKLQHPDNRKKRQTRGKTNLNVATVCSIDDVKKMQSDLADIPYNPRLVELMLQVEDALEENSIFVNDRRMEKMQEVCHAAIEAFGESPEDAVLKLADMLWNEPEERASILQIVSKAANPDLGEAIEYFDGIKEKFDSAARVLSNMKKKWANEQDKSVLKSNTLTTVNKIKDDIDKAAATALASLPEKSLKVKDLKVKISEMRDKSKEMVLEVLNYNG